MHSLHIKSGYYLNGDFSSVSEKVVWEKLIKYIKNNKKDCALSLFQNDGIIKIISDSESELFDIIKEIDIENTITKNIYRSAKITSEFDESYKNNLKITNIEDINYFISFDSNFENKNSLFFDKNYILSDYDEYSGSNDYLAIIYNDSDKIFVGYNKTNGKMFKDEGFEYLNSNKFNLDNLINEYNSEGSISSYSVKITNFKLMNGSLSVLKLKSISSSVKFDKFIEILIS